MSLLNFLDDKRIPLGINVFIAWVIATLFFLQTKVVPDINLTPIDLAIQAGLIYGYYRIIVLAIRLLLLPFIVFGAGLGFIENISNLGGAEGTKKENKLTKVGKWISGVIIRISEVAGILIVFLFHPENFVYALAPIGLVLILLLYIFTENEEKDTKKEPDAKQPENSRISPTYVEIVNQSEIPVKFDNTSNSPMYVEYANSRDPIPVPVNIKYIEAAYGELPIIAKGTIKVDVSNSSSIPVQVTNEVAVINAYGNSPLSVEVTNDQESPLPVEVINIIKTQQDEGS